MSLAEWRLVKSATSLEVHSINYTKVKLNVGINNWDEILSKAFTEERKKWPSQVDSLDEWEAVFEGALEKTAQCVLFIVSPPGAGSFHQPSVILFVLLH